MLDFLRRREREDVSIDLGGGAVQVTFNHRLKVAFLFTLDPDTPDGAYNDLEQHLAKRGYFLQIVIASVGMSPTLPADRA